MRQRAALRLGGRPGRVHHDRDVPDADAVGRRVDGRVVDGLGEPVELRPVDEPLGRARPEHDRVPNARRVRDRAAEEPDEVDLVAEHVARQHRGERGVLEDVGELGRAEPRVHGDDLDAEQRAAEERGVVVDAVRRDDPDALAPADPERVQPAGDPVRVREQLDRGQPLLVRERDGDVFGHRRAARTRTSPSGITSIGAPVAHVLRGGAAGLRTEDERRAERPPPRGRRGQ